MMTMMINKLNTSNHQGQATLHLD